MNAHVSVPPLRALVPVGPALVGPALLGLALVVGACGDPDTPPAGPPPPPPALPSFGAHQAGVAVAPGLATSAVDEGCGECHAEIVAAYARSGMHEALTLPGGEGTVESRMLGREVVHEPTGIRVRFDARDGRYEQTLRYVDPAGIERVAFRLPVDLVIGSGAAARSYLAAQGSGLFMLPLSWYRELDALDLSPGPGFHDIATRAAPTLCIQCHTGDAEPATPGVAFGFRGDLSLGVGCSRCHGDGAEHAETGDPRDVVNPARLALERQNELCYQCHFSGAEQFFVPGKHLAAFAPGEPLSGVMGVYFPREQLEDGGAAVAGHVVRLHRSTCFTASTDMTCTTCHNPHRPAADARDAQGCGLCHDAGDCGEAHAARGEQTCADCHMSRVAAADIRHTSTTDHWIRRRPTVPDSGTLAPEAQRLGAHALADRELVDVLDPEGLEPHARLLLAHAYLSGVEQAAGAFGAPAPAYLVRAESLLDELLEEDPDHVEALWRRARAWRLRGRPGPGVALLDRALVAMPEHPDALRERAIVASMGDDPRAAVDWLQRARALHPDDLTLVHALAQTYERAGFAGDALDVLDAARRRHGPRVDIADIGAALALRVGALDAAISFGWDRLVFRSRDAYAVSWQGDVLRAAGRPAEARTMFDEALRLDSGCVDALLGLAELAGSSGDDDAARTYVERARRVAPDHPAFRPR